MKPQATNAPNPYGEVINSADVMTGANAWPYTTPVPSYGAPGPIGQSIRRALGGFFAWANAEQYPGLEDNRAALYSIATPQAFIRPSAQRPPDPGTPSTWPNIPTGINKR